MASSFDAVPRTPAGHFRLHFYAAVFRLVLHCYRLTQSDGEALEELQGRFPFLRGYLAEMRRYMPAHLTWQDALDWLEAEIERWEGGCPDHLPLRALGEQAGIGPPERAALLLAGLVEEDARFGSLFAWLQQPLGQRRPTVELLEQLAGAGRPAGSGSSGACRRLLAAGLVEAANPEAARPEWELSVPHDLWDVARGDIALLPPSWYRYRPLAELPELGDLVLPEPLRQELAGVKALLAGGKVRMAILRGSPASERREALSAVARGLGWGVIDVAAAQLGTNRREERLGALCAMARAIPLIQYDLGPGETAVFPDLAGYPGPVAAVIGAEGGLRGELPERAITLTFPTLTQPLRRQRWERALQGQPTEDLDEIAAQFHLPGGHIRQAAAMAVARAGLDGRERVSVRDVREACRTLNREALDALAVRLEPRGTWAELVATEATAGRLRELERRCRYRERMLDHLSPVIGAAQNRGVRALFTGPSGTGKTMAAVTLAAALNMDIYRVDLAAVVNKYIGETEKNLHQVLSRAEELDVILLLDEGDALMARRTEVRSANDRYANLETNYLLQRLEQYQGIVLVTTNAGEIIDTAFRRRMDVLVPFVPPGQAERQRLWAVHLPAAHAVAPAYLREVARRCALTGGQIRNVVLHATLLSLERGGLITGPVLTAALQTEYAKAGAICPLAAERGSHQADGGVAEFVERMRGQS